MEGTPTNRAKGKPSWFVSLCKWLWKMNRFVWAMLLTFIASLIVNIVALSVTSPSSTSIYGTPVGWLLKSPLIILIIVICLLLLNMVIYLGSHVDLGLSAEVSFSDKELKHVYLKRMIRETETLSLQGIPAGLVAASVSLDDVFIPLEFRRNRPLTDYPLTTEELGRFRDSIKRGVFTNEIQDALFEAEKSWQHMPKETDRSSITDLWQQLTSEHPVAVIQGYPGMGKTTLLTRLTLHMARRSLGQPDPMMLGNLEPPLIPIILRLGDYAREYKYNVSDCSLSKYLKLAMERLDIPGLDSFLEKSLRASRCLIMLDGLDEISNSETKRSVEEAIKAFMFEYSPPSNGAINFNRFLITSRVAGYDQSTFRDYPHYIIAELTTRQGEEFLMCWSRANARRILVEQEKEVLTEGAALMAKSFAAALAVNQDVGELAKNPLLLTLLIVMQQNSIVLPRGRVDLCTLVTRTLLENRNIAKNLPLIPEAVAVHRLGLIAFQMQESGNSIIRQKKVMKLLTQSIALEGGTPDQIAQEAEEFLNRIRERGGIFVQRSSDYFGFMYRIFQEYFAARYFLIEMRHDPDYCLSELIKRVRRFDELWREPFLLAVAYSSNENEVLTNQIIQALLDTSLKDNFEAQKHDLLLAVECLIETKPFTIDRLLERRIAEQLLGFYQKAQQGQQVQICNEIESVIRRWLESLPKEVYRPALLTVLQEAVSDRHDMARQNSSVALLATIGWTKQLEAVE